jgi:hypothetical protein
MVVKERQAADYWRFPSSTQMGNRTNHRATSRSFLVDWITVKTAVRRSCTESSRLKVEKWRLNSIKSRVGRSQHFHWFSATHFKHVITQSLVQSSCYFTEPMAQIYNANWPKVGNEVRVAKDGVDCHFINILPTCVLYKLCSWICPNRINIYMSHVSVSGSFKVPLLLFIRLSPINYCKIEQDTLGM